MKIVEPSVTLLACTPDPEKLIERAGRTCYKSDNRITDDSHVAFIRMILDPKKAHESVLEHASASFLVVTDRGVTHEQVRHRIGAYSQESTRYCNYSKDKFGEEIAVVKPVDLPDSGRAFAIWKFAMRVSQWAYFGLLKLGFTPQVARSVLPTCLKTEIVVTYNMREWRHFLRLRMSPAAHPDMRVISRMLRDELVKIAPTCFEDFVEGPNG